MEIIYITISSILTTLILILTIYIFKILYYKNYIKDFFFQTCFGMFICNFIFSFNMNIFMIGITKFNNYSIFCKFYNFILNFEEKLCLYLILFAVFERYIKIYHGPKKHQNIIKKTSKILFFLPFVLFILILTIIEFEWKHNSSNIINDNKCYKNSWIIILRSKIIMIAYFTIFLILVMYFEFKMLNYVINNMFHIYLSQNIHTLHIFKSGHIVTKMCVKITYFLIINSTIFTIFGIILQTIINTIIYLNLIKISKITKFELQNFTFIFFKLYFLIVEIIFIYFVEIFNPKKKHKFFQK